MIESGSAETAVALVAVLLDFNGGLDTERLVLGLYMDCVAWGRIDEKSWGKHSVRSEADKLVEKLNAFLQKYTPDVFDDEKYVSQLQSGQVLFKPNANLF